MNTKQFIKPLLFLFLSVTLLTSCSSDSSSSSGDTDQIFDKWWYDSEDFTADVFFHADGTYEQFLEFSGMSFSNTGTWVWENESQKIMKVTYETGPNAVTEAWFKFSNIQEHSFNIKQSVDGTTFTDEARIYNDTEE